MQKFKLKFSPTNCFPFHEVGNFTIGMLAGRSGKQGNNSFSSLYPGRVIRFNGGGDELVGGPKTTITMGDVPIIDPYLPQVVMRHLSTRRTSVNGFPKAQEQLNPVPVQPGAWANLPDVSGKKYCPLHYTAEEGSHRVMKILLTGGANPSAREGGYGRTSLHLLLRKWKNKEEDFKACLDLLLDHEKINVDSKDDNKDTALYLACRKECEYMVRKLIIKGANTITEFDLIRSKFPGLLESIVKSDYLASEKKVRHYGDELLDEGLKEQNLEKFKSILSEVDKCEDKNDILEEDYGKTLLQFACDDGLTKFVDALLNSGADPMMVDKTNGNCPILYASRKGYHKIVDLLTNKMEKIEKIEEGLQQVDQRGENPLHKVVKQEYRTKGKYQDRDYDACMESLMKYRKHIDLDATDEDGNTALHYAVLWEKHSFVRHLLLNGAHWGIKNNAGTMPITNIKASGLEEILNDCIKLNDGSDLDYREFEVILNYCMLVPAHKSQKTETERLKFLSGSRSHQHLLCHPIINTFLYLKWQRIEPYYYFNVLSYLIYLILLTAYILIFHGIIKEPNTPSPISNSTENVNSLPTINSTSEIIETESAIDYIALKLSLQLIILLFTLYMAVREIVQFFVSWRLYIARIENWLEISLVIMTIALFLPVGSHIQQNLAAWLILCSWTEFVLLLGCHPVLAVYITMFTKVAFNFLKFILLFSFMIIAFSLSFYLVFQVNENFMTYHQSFLRTVAMSTGELEYTELPLSSFPISSHLLFILFVFLIVLVLMNLLNGLAVSDIVQIQKEAEIVSYKSRVELISYLESVFLVGACPISSIFPESLNCCSSDSDSNPVARLLNWLGPKTLMLRNCLNNQSIKMFPNRTKGKCWEICACHSSSLEKSHIDSAMSVVLAEEHKVSDSISQLRQEVRTLTEMVRNHVLVPSPMKKLH
ncbi:unnamed protein product, partial [Meganyctiphanes norvegica]